MKYQYLVLLFNLIFVSLPSISKELNIKIEHIKVPHDSIRGVFPDGSGYVGEARNDDEYIYNIGSDEPISLNLNPGSFASYFLLKPTTLNGERRVLQQVTKSGKTQLHLLRDNGELLKSMKIPGSVGARTSEMKLSRSGDFLLFWLDNWLYVVDVTTLSIKDKISFPNADPSYFYISNNGERVTLRDNNSRHFYSFALDKALSEYRPLDISNCSELFEVPPRTVFFPDGNSYTQIGWGYLDRDNGQQYRDSIFCASDGQNSLFTTVGIPSFGTTTVFDSDDGIVIAVDSTHFHIYDSENGDLLSSFLLEDYLEEHLEEHEMYVPYSRNFLFQHYNDFSYDQESNLLVFRGGGGIRNYIFKFTLDIN